jgi:hypothetical protein
MGVFGEAVEGLASGRRPLSRALGTRPTDSPTRKAREFIAKLGDDGPRCNGGSLGESATPGAAALTGDNVAD